MHIPLRMCVVCREHKPTEELMRITHNVKTDKPEPDINGKNTGRGAYICKSSACLKKAIKSKRIQNNLEVEIGEELITALTGEIENQ